MPVNKQFLYFSAKLFLSTKLTFSEKIKSRTLALKRVNFENKVLFGNLLETRKERKKRISKINESVVSNPEPVVKCQKINEDAKNNSLIKDLSAKVCNEAKAPKKSTKIKIKDGKNKNFTATEPYIETKTEFSSISCFSKNLNHYGDANVIEENQLRSLVESTSNLDSEEVFPLVNQGKTELQMKNEEEIIMGRTIVKSTSFYKYPSVTRILNLTMSDGSKSALLRWRNNLIAEMGEEKFQEFYRNQLALGSQFHANLQDFLVQLPPRNSSVLSENLEGCWKSLKTVFTTLSDVKLLESHVVHEKLKYRGVIDCIALYRDMPLIIEWKKSSKRKQSLKMTYDAPLQLSAYIGALNYDSSYSFKVTKGVVVVAYDDGAPADIFLLSPNECELYWKEWLLRYRKYSGMVQTINGTEKEEKKERLTGTES